MEKLKIKITGDIGIYLLQKFGNSTFECELIHETEIVEHWSGDNAIKPYSFEGVSEFHRFYLAISPLPVDTKSV